MIVSIISVRSVRCFVRVAATTSLITGIIEQT